MGGASGEVADGALLEPFEAAGRGVWKGAKGTPMRFSLLALLPANNEFKE